MKTRRWFWILGWILFLLSSAAFAFTNISRYGFHNEVTKGFIVKRGYEITVSYLMIILVLVLAKLLAFKVFFKKNSFNFLSLFKTFLSISLFSLSFCLMLAWWFVRVFFWETGQEIVRFSGLFLYIVVDFLLSRKFLMEFVKKVKFGAKWNLTIFGLTIISHLLFVLIFWFLTLINL